MTDTYTFLLPLPPIGKARPRFCGHAYLPKAYRAWRDAATDILRHQWPHPPLEHIDHCEVQLFGGRGMTDADNAAGSVLDALVRAGILTDDRLRVLPSLSVHWQHAATGRIEVLLVVGGNGVSASSGDVPGACDG